MKRSAFTIIELIFVIVVLGILAAVALPKMGSSMEHAYIAQAQGDVGAIRSAIASERQKVLVRGINDYITTLSTAAGAVADGTNLFDGNGTLTLLMYPIVAQAKGGWTKTAALTYTFSIDGTAAKTATFTYTPANGRFDCDHTEAICKRIVE